MRTIGMACLAVCLIGFADAWAENAIGESTGPTAPNENCARYKHLAGADEALSTGGHGTSSIPIDGKAADIPIWKSITLGTHDSANALRETLKAARCEVGDLADNVLDQPEFSVSKSRTGVNLTVLSVAQLSFGVEGASRAQIYRRAAQLGLELCPPEIGPQLRLQYLDQPLGELLHIAMAPMTTDGGDLVGLSVGNGGAGLLLVGDDVRPDRIVPPSARFVFVRLHSPKGPGAGGGHGRNRIARATN
jgi:hypothetical protein